MFLISSLSLSHRLHLPFFFMVFLMLFISLTSGKQCLKCVKQGAANCDSTTSLNCPNANDVCFDIYGDIEVTITKPITQNGQFLGQDTLNQRQRSHVKGCAPRAYLDCVRTSKWKEDTKWKKADNCFGEPKNLKVAVTPKQKALEDCVVKEKGQKSLGHPMGPEYDDLLRAGQPPDENGDAVTVTVERNHIVSMCFCEGDLCKPKNHNDISGAIKVRGAEAIVIVMVTFSAVIVAVVG